MGTIAGDIPIAPTSDCSNCHNTSTFAGGFVDHTSPTVTSQQCTDCHDGAHTWSFVDSTGATVTLPIQGTPTTPQVLVDSTCCRSRTELRQLSLGRREFFAGNGGSQ